MAGPVSPAAADVDAAARVRGGLPLLRARAAKAARGAALGAKVVFCGGSVTAQRDGWRPAFQAWLDKALPTPLGHEALCAALGNCGSKVVAFTLADWVVPPHERPPDLVVIEAVINDGDALLETGDTTSVRRALEGVVRGVKAAAPAAELLFVLAHLRTDLPQARRSGTLAWVHSEGGDAAEVYSRVAPGIHEQVAEHYGIPSVNISTALRGLPPATLDQLFRDDCHTTPAGAAVMAFVVAACVQKCLDGAPGGDASMPRAPLPPALDPLHWSGGRTLPVTRAELQLAAGSRTTQVMDVDPLTGQRGQWWLLAPGGEDALVLRFDGTALALLTHQGPDSGILRCELRREGADDDVIVLQRCLFDCWSYYYRLSVVVLAEGLPPGRYTARITLEASPPDRSSAKRPLQAAVAGPLRLWLCHALTLNSAAFDSRALAAQAHTDTSSSAVCAPDAASAPAVALQRQPVGA